MCAYPLTPRHHALVVDPLSIVEELSSVDHEAEVWSFQPRHQLDWHAHAAAKTVFCVRGHVVFHTAAGDIDMRPGDRLDIPAGAMHAATVSDNGVTCIETQRGL